MSSYSSPTRARDAGSAGATSDGAGRHAPGRIWRGLDSDRVPAATFAVDLPADGPTGALLSVADRIEAARAQGYERGRADAAAELAASAAGERSAAVGRAAAALAGAAQAVAACRQQAVRIAELEVVALALDLAEAIVQRELTIGRDAAIAAVQRALGLVPAGEDLVVRLHPGDAIEPAELQALVPDRQVLVVADPAVEPGGCVVDAGPCHVDAQIGPALDRAREVLAQLRPDAGAPRAVPAA